MSRSAARYIALTVLVVGALARADRPIGRSSTYERYCTACHGERGDGRGPAAPFTWGVPRDFTHGDFKYDDLATTIKYGIPGTSMHGFGDVLSARELADVIADVGAPKLSAVAVGPTRPINRDRGDYLWKSAGCATCHGDGGKGDGPAAKSFAPYDLTALPLHRPREHDDLESRRRAAAISIATGIRGTPMPGYAGTLNEVDLWALADHVTDLGANAKRTGIAMDPDAIARDKLESAIWPGTGSDSKIWGAHLAAQGAPPAALAPAEASLSAQQCGRCHAKQFREWSTSLHGDAASAGLYAQLDAGIADTCRRCHAPLAEQAPGPVYEAKLHDEGVTCASCHVRAWTRHGPGASSTLLAAPGYPKQDLPIYERADFCLPCHQLPPRNGLEGKPMLNTYKEWLEGPYMRRGIQCQHCHMPNREHQWLGVHDRATFRQAIALDIDARHTARGASVVADLKNVGAGHYLPTTPTPAVWLRIELLDERGAAIDGANDELRIGRDIYWDGAWHQRADTRIPPGEKVTFAKAWQGGRVNEATTARVTVEVWPDAYYEGFYKTHLNDRAAPNIRALYEQALARASSSHYVAEQVLIQLKR